MSSDTYNQLLAELTEIYHRPNASLKTITPLNSVAQDILRYLFSPAVGHFSAMIHGKPGSGKTRASLNVVNQIVDTLSTGKPTKHNPVIILSYNSYIFENEMAINHEHGMIGEFDVLREYLDLPVSERKSALRSFYSIYGYKKFESLVFLGTVEEKECVFSGNHTHWDDILDGHIKAGWLKLNHEFIQSLDGSIIIADEIHVVHSGGYLNRLGLTISYIKRHLKNLSLIILDATPISKLSLEIVSIANLMFGASYSIDDFFSLSDDRYVLRKKSLEVLKEIGRNTYILEQPAITSCPSFVVEGMRLKKRHKDENIPDENYVFCHLTEYQEYVIQKYCHGRKERRIAETAAAVFNDALVTNEVASDVIIGRLFKTREDSEMKSAKLAMIGLLLFGFDLIWKPGICTIYTLLIVYPGSRLIRHYLRQLGLIPYGSQKPKTSLCLKCKGRHRMDDHTSIPPRYAELNRSIHENDFNEIFNTYNSVQNKDGHLIKVLIATECINVGITLMNTHLLMCYDLPRSIPLSIQLKGRFDRPDTIFNILMDKIVHVCAFISQSKFRETIEEQHIKVKDRNWKGVRPIIEFIIKYSRTLTFMTVDRPGTKYIDGPVYIPRQAGTFNTAADIVKYREYKLIFDEPSEKHRKILSRPGRELLIPSLSRRITIASQFIKAQMILHNVIKVEDVMREAKRLKVFLMFNIENLTIDDIVIAGEIMSMLGEKLSIPGLDDCTAAIESEEQFRYMFELLMISPTSPWTLDGNGNLRRVYMYNHIFYYISSDKMNLHPVYRQFVGPDDIFRPIEIGIERQIMKSSSHLRNVVEIIENFRDDMTLNILININKMDLDIFLLNLIMGKDISSQAINKFIKLLISFGMLFDKDGASAIIGDICKSSYPIAYIQRNFYMFSSGQPKIITEQINKTRLKYKYADIIFQLSEVKGKFKLLIYNTVYRVLEKDEKDKRKVRRGVNINKTNKDKVMEVLNAAVSTLSQRLIDMADEYDIHSDYQTAIIKYITEKQLSGDGLFYVKII